MANYTWRRRCLLLGGGALLSFWLAGDWHAAMAQAELPHAPLLHHGPPAMGNERLRVIQPAAIML